MLGTHKKKQPEGCFFISPDSRNASVITAQFPQPLNRRDLSRRIRQLRLRGCVFEVRTRVLQRFFSALLRFQRLRFIEILTADRGIGQNRHYARLNLENPASNEHKLFVTVLRFDTHCTRTNPRDERRVARQNAEFTRFARQRDELRTAREDLLFCADDVYLNSCHIDSNRTRFSYNLRARPSLLNLLGLFKGFVDGADHVERLLRQMITFTFNDHLETTDGFLQRNVLAAEGNHPWRS